MHPLVQALLPSACACCGEILVQGERQMCLSCLCSLNPTGYSTQAENPIERTLGSQLKIESASSTFFFHHGSTIRRAVHAMKFYDNPELCTLLGRQVGLDIAASGRFDDVSVIVPVPLHPLRKLNRGYNQSHLLALGIADIIHRKVYTRGIVRRRHTSAQSSIKEASVRASNTNHAFALLHTAPLRGQHILLVDDVLTTGATLIACTEVLQRIPDVKISVATLAVSTDD